MRGNAEGARYSRLGSEMADWHKRDVRVEVGPHPPPATYRLFDDAPLAGNHPVVANVGCQ